MELSIIDGWWLHNPPQMPPKLIAAEHGRRLTVEQKRLYRRIEKQAEESHKEDI
jgi:hypothetical protein